MFCHADAFSLLAQDVLKVHGIVTDPSGEPLIGVNVKAGSSSVGAVTDLDGKYSIEVSPKSTLTFSYVGFETVVESGRTADRWTSP